MLRDLPQQCEVGAKKIQKATKVPFLGENEAKRWKFLTNSWQDDIYR
jgi:hypothetical protein